MKFFGLFFLVCLVASILFIGAFYVTMDATQVVSFHASAYDFVYSLTPLKALGLVLGSIVAICFLFAMYFCAVCGCQELLWAPELPKKEVIDSE